MSYVHLIILMKHMTAYSLPCVFVIQDWNVFSKSSQQPPTPTCFISSDIMLLGSPSTGLNIAPSAINRARIRANDLAWRESKGPSYKIAARERTAEWRKDNIEQYRITNKQYAKKNKERIASYQVEYYAKNVEIKKRNAREWLKNNRVKSNKTKAQYNAKHPEQNRISRHNRRAKIRKTGGKLSKGLATKLIQLQQGKCACCALPLGDNFHLDHIMPIKLGGQNIDSNIQLLRSTCNQQKHAKHPVDFMRESGFLL
jgi:hypothetical protein